MTRREGSVGCGLIAFLEAQVAVLLVPSRRPPVDGEAGRFGDADPRVALRGMEPSAAEVERQPRHLLCPGATADEDEMTKASIDLQDLRRRIYVKAKAEPSWRFWGLYVHVCKMETLRAAYEIAKQNDGAPGVDGVTFEAIEASGRLDHDDRKTALHQTPRSHARRAGPNDDDIGISVHGSPKGLRRTISGHPSRQSLIEETGL